MDGNYEDFDICIGKGILYCELTTEYLTPINSFTISFYVFDIESCSNGNLGCSRLNTGCDKLYLSSKLEGFEVLQNFQCHVVFLQPSRVTFRLMCSIIS